MEFAWCCQFESVEQNDYLRGSDREGDRDRDRYKEKEKGGEREM